MPGCCITAIRTNVTWTTSVCPSGGRNKPYIIYHSVNLQVMAFQLINYHKAKSLTFKEKQVWPDCSYLTISMVKLMVIAVSSWYWWQYYVGDFMMATILKYMYVSGTFIMLMTFFLVLVIPYCMWESVINISKLSSTRTMSNICH